MEHTSNKKVTGKVPDPRKYDYSDKGLARKSLYAKGHPDLFKRLYK